MATIKKEVSKEPTKPKKTTPKTSTSVVASDKPVKVKTPKPVAKAGKRSLKAVQTAEEKSAKEARKTEVATQEIELPKKVIKPPRSRLERRSKKYRKVAATIDRTKTYGLAEALSLIIKSSPVKFDATVELHIKLNVDPKIADQNIRDIVVLPAGTGKKIRVAVFADADTVTAAKKAGADLGGSEEFLQKLDKEQLDFDVLIATPAVMGQLGKYARLLGPKGLMPNPKSGTVTNDVVKAVEQAKKGRVEYRVDSTSIVHLGIGKISFGDTLLLSNAQAVIASIRSNKPSSIKGTFIGKIYIASTMGPSIPVDMTQL